MAERLIEVRDLSKAYGGQPVIEGLSLVLDPGAIVGLIGPSGGGKTTTLRMFAGLLRPDAGGGHVLGEDVHLPEPRRRRRIGYMGQRLALYPDLTVLENFSAQAEMFAVPAAHRAIAAVTERYDLRPLLARRFGALSAGEARRVQFAATVLHAPPLLLLDEPTIGFDAETGHDIWRWLATLAAEGHGVVVSTNNPSEAERCDTVVLHRDRRALPQQSPGGLPAAFGGEGFGAVFG